MIKEPFKSSWGKTHEDWTKEKLPAIYPIMLIIILLSFIAFAFTVFYLTNTVNPI